MSKSGFQVHECAGIPDKGIYLFYSHEGEEGYADAWNLAIRRESTEDDLEENHHLEEVGETMWETLLEVSRCPFCGQQLSEGRSSREGNFLHRDYSGYRSSVV